MFCPHHHSRRGEELHPFVNRTHLHILRTSTYRLSEERLKTSQHTYPDDGNILYLRNVGF
jgi:hypothetical protein